MGRPVPADEITLTIPREADFHRVAHLVLGGLAVRLDLTIENLEDLQLALDAVLGETDPAVAPEDVTVRMSPQPGELVTTVGPLSERLLSQVDADLDDELGLRRVLESTVDDVHVEGAYIRLTKKVARG
jgi:hypothetical protein